MTNNRLEIYQNNDKTIFCAVTDSSGTAFILTDYIPYFYAKKYPVRTTNPVDISVLGTITDPSQGAITFQLSDTDTSVAAGDYEYQIVIYDLYNTHTIVSDRLSILSSLK
jgi:hypothetical protein